MQKAKKRSLAVKRTPEQLKSFGNKMAKLVGKTTDLEINHMKSKGVI